MNTVIEFDNAIDPHVHFRTIADGRLPKCVHHTAYAASFAIVMPNTNPHIFTTEDAIGYARDINYILQKSYGYKHDEKFLDACRKFRPLVTIYLTPNTDLDDMERGFSNGHISSGKQYPAGATTNSDDGFENIEEMFHVYERMEKIGMPLHIHCEMPAFVKVDVFESEAMAIKKILIPILERFPNLKVVMEHITTKEAVDLVQSGIYPNLRASVTPQHLLYFYNHMLRGKLDIHLYCFPILKAEKHMLAIQEAVASGDKSDTAPHMKSDKMECGCAGVYSGPVWVEAYTMFFQQADALQHMQAFMSDNFCEFFGYEIPKEYQKTVVVEEVDPWVVPDDYDGIVPLFHGQELNIKARVLD